MHHRVRKGMRENEKVIGGIMRGYEKVCEFLIGCERVCKVMRGYERL